MATRAEQGFSLVEIVVAIVLMSILSIGLVQFITNSATSYSESAARNQVSAAGRVVIDRIAMDLHNALPQSVRISAVNLGGIDGNQCLEFIPIRAATTYLDPAFRPAAHKAAFDVVDLVPAQLGVTGVYAVIYPTSSADLYAAAFGPGNATEAIARVNVTNGVDPNTDTLTYSRLSDDAPYNHRFKRRSSVGRLYLADMPVSYCVLGTKLYRYNNYGFDTVQSTPASGLPATTPNRVLMTDQVDNSLLTGGLNGQAFDRLDASRSRNAVIQLELNFSQAGQQVRLNHEVLQQATP
jgi:MSHA biogenesis protein MshO